MVYGKSQVNMIDNETAPESDKPPIELITFQTFLEEYPIGTCQNVSGYYKEDFSQNIYYRLPKCTPILRLHCDECKGTRNFEGEWTHYKYLNENIKLDDYIVYTCRDCGKYEKHFCLISSHIDENGNGKALKIGEYPELYIKLPSNLSSLFGEDYNYFIKGLKCEKRGLGLGAYSYYRRVVENQKDRLLGEILKVSEKLSARQEIIDTLKNAISETQFSKAMDMVKESLPEILLVDGLNPFKLLHKSLSIGIHNMPDEECLEIAHNIRMVLIDLFERIKIALSEKRDLHSAVTSLLKFNQTKNP